MLIFSGGEGSHHRSLLESVGVSEVEVSFWRLRQKKVSETKPYLLKDKFPASTQVYLDSGSIPAQKAYAKGTLKVTDYYAHYLTFLGWNESRISAAGDLWIPGVGDVEERREMLEEILGRERLWVTWDHSMGVRELYALAEEYPHVGITGDSVEAETTLATRVRSLRTRYGTRFHALATAKPEDLRSVDFATATTLSWVSPMMRGETIVWDGTRLVRYRKDRKDQARSRARAIAERAGLDFTKIRNDDPAEVTRLALWSLLQMDKHMTERKGHHLSDSLPVAQGTNPFTPFQKTPDVDNIAVSEEGAFQENEDDLVGSRLPEMRNARGTQPVVRRDPAERQVLPSFGLEIRQTVETDEAGNQVLRERPILSSPHQSMRQCDTCFVAANCPAFQPSNECAYHLPVEVKTKEQMKALLNAVIEMQGQRVAFMRFAEETNGGYADPNLSSEIDRLYRLVETVKNLEETRESLKISVERQSSAGVLSAIFGDRANILRELPNGGLNEEQTTRVINGEVI